ncbi:MAG TPA: hypothetical protein VGX03_30550 [Candidatus Binatia bacterium]|nr:hypothetical protein [Candidatus Binatia bacterium]
MRVVSEMSDEPRDKLRAVLNHDRPDPDGDLGVAYRDACGQWFAALAGADRSDRRSLTPSAVPSTLRRNPA